MLNGLGCRSSQQMSDCELRLGSSLPQTVNLGPKSYSEAIKKEGSKPQASASRP